MKGLNMLIHMTDIFHKGTLCDFHMRKFTGNTVLPRNSVNVLNQIVMRKVLPG